MGGGACPPHYGILAGFEGCFAAVEVESVDLEAWTAMQLPLF